MKSRNQPLQEEKQKVPAYIVTYSDMVTLLLTFFVLLLTLAKVQDAGLIYKGRESFWESIRLFGLGALLGNEVGPDLDATMTKYPTTEPETTPDRALDEYREKLRRIFERLRQSMTTLPSQIVGHRLDFSITGVRFGRGEALLNEDARQYLSTYCLDLRQNVSAENCTLYVLGLAGDEVTEMQQWILSARRAQAVAQFLQGQLDRNTGGPVAAPSTADPPPWRVLWWGAGPGGNWAGQDRPDPGQSQILIAMLRSGG